MDVVIVFLLSPEVGVFRMVCGDPDADLAVMQAKRPDREPRYRWSRRISAETGWLASIVIVILAQNYQNAAVGTSGMPTFRTDRATAPHTAFADAEVAKTTAVAWS
ncbi:hypothetical protein [Nocardia fluminea]|uniref:hypothetical protein n=1 Tax=Nocardia fluminea TaxID=134984 RepID=UPI00379E96C6